MVGSTPQESLSPDRQSVVLFSGGRDSSLAACLEINSGYETILMTAASGATIPTDVVVSRVDEIRRAFPNQVIEWTTRHASGIFRRIALADIESDFSKYKTNLILLGHQLAIQCEGLCLCRERGIGRMVSGFSGYQSPGYMEQTPEAIELFRSFCDSFGVSFVTPIVSYAALDDVKFRLLDFGVTTKSLEAVSLFADSFSPASPESVIGYLEEKLPIAREYVSFKSGSAKF
jgi:7-cyano-7-deazaguanine synthase in queuosine biosynthesis